MRMTMELRWNDSDWGEAEVFGDKLVTAYHKSHTNWSGIEPGLCGVRPAKHHLNHDTALDAIKTGNVRIG